MGFIDATARKTHLDRGWSGAIELAPQRLRGVDINGAFRGSAVDQITQAVFANLNDITVLQAMLFDGLTIDGGAVGGAEIFKISVGARGKDDGVLSTDGQVVDDDIVM